MPVYTVQPGDTLSEIAQRFGTSVETIESANPFIRDPNLIFPGQILCVPKRPNPQVPPIQVYVVQSGDTLNEIAQRFGSTVRAIVRFNDIEDPDIIFPDQILCLPRAPLVQPVYEVQPGDTLSAIAQRFGSRVDAIAQRNNLADPDRIFPGQILRIPIEIF
jgi:LysM repeat protein